MPPEVTADQTGIVRSPAGEILPPIKETTETKTETKVEPEVKTETKVEIKTEDKEKSLLNQGEKKDDAKIPEKYEDFKVPEGYTLDPTVATEAGTLFKELGLNQTNAQRLVDFYVKQANDAAEAPYKAYADMREVWRNEVKNDPELGRNLDGVKATVSKAIDSLGPTLAGQFREAMDVTGLGDHPAFIRALYALSKQLTEGTAISGGGPSKFGQLKPGTRPDAAHALYPNLP